MDESKIEKIEPREEIFDPEKITEKEYKVGLDETVKKFTANLRELENPEYKLDELRELIGEIKITPRYKKLIEEEMPPEKAKEMIAGHIRTTELSGGPELPRELKFTDKLIKLYEKDSFKPSECKDIEYAATFLFTEAIYRLKTLAVSSNSGPIDRLENFTIEEKADIKIKGIPLEGGESFNEIVSKGSTDFYDKLEKTIKYIWAQAREIEKEIVTADDSEFKKEVTKGLPEDLTEDQSRDYLRPFYLKEEFKRKDRVIPLLNKMRFVYQAGVDIIKGMSKEHPKHKEHKVASEK